MPQTHREDPELLRAALVGLQHSLGAIDQRISDLRSQLGGQKASRRLPVAQDGTPQNNSKRTLSAAARRRIALAQKKRWAAYKADQGKAAAPKTVKRELSAEGRARIIAATKKRWAAFRKAQAAAAKPAPKKTSRQKAAKKAPLAAPAPVAAAAATPATE